MLASVSKCSLIFVDTEVAKRTFGQRSFQRIGEGDTSRKSLNDVHANLNQREPGTIKDAGSNHIRLTGLEASESERTRTRDKFLDSEDQ